MTAHGAAAWAAAAAAAFCALALPARAHQSANGGTSAPLRPSNCSALELASRVRVAPGTVAATVLPGAGGGGAAGPFLGLSFGIELDERGDGSEWSRLSWDELLVHHDRRMHAILVGADFGSFIHAHPPNPAGSDQTTFSIEIPLPPPGEYAAGIDFVAASDDFAPCAAAAAAGPPPPPPPPSSSPAPTESDPVEIEGHAEFVVRVPAGPASRPSSSFRPEVPSNRGALVQSVVVSPALLVGDTTMFEDRASQEACCRAEPRCTSVSVLLADESAAGGIGCTTMQFALTDRMTGAGLPAEVYLSAPTHIALARRGAAGAPPFEVRHIHGRHGSVGAVGAGCAPVAPHVMGADDGPADASVWAVAAVDPDAEYKAFATFNTSNGVVVAVFTVGGDAATGMHPGEPVCAGVGEEWSGPHAGGEGGASATVTTTTGSDSWGTLTHVELVVLLLGFMVITAVVNGRAIRRLAKTRETAAAIPLSGTTTV